MACTCRGSDPGVVLRAGAGIVISGTGTPSSPFDIETDLAEALSVEVRDTATVNLTLTGIGTPEDPYVISADTAGAITLANLGDVISGPPDPGAIPTWVAAAGGTPGHWAFIVPPVASTTLDATKLTGLVPNASLPGRLGATANVLATGFDVNTINSSGWYVGTGLQHAPDSTQWWYIESIVSSASNSVQIAYRMAGDDTYRRRNIGGTWGAWQRVFSASDLAAGYLDSRYPHIGGTNVITDAMLPFASASGYTHVDATTPNNGGFSGTTDVSFPPGRFTDSPNIQLTAATGAGAAQHLGVNNVTKDGFQVFYWRAASTTGVMADRKSVV